MYFKKKNVALGYSGLQSSSVQGVHRPSVIPLPVTVFGRGSNSKLAPETSRLRFSLRFPQNPQQKCYCFPLSYFPKR